MKRRMKKDRKGDEEREEDGESGEKRMERKGRIEWSG